MSSSAASMMQVPRSWSCRRCCQFLPARWRLNLLMADASSRPPEAIRRRSDDMSPSGKMRDADHTIRREDPLGARSHRHEKLCGAHDYAESAAANAQLARVSGDFYFA